MPPQRVTNIAFDQDGLITRPQAIAAGASNGFLTRALKGRWQIVLPGVYATFTGSLGLIHRLRAAVLYGGLGALVTGAQACKLCKLQYGPNPGGVIDVLVQPTRQGAEVNFKRLQREDGWSVRLHRTERMPDGRITWEDRSPEAKWFLKSGPSRGYTGDGLTDRARPWTIPLAPYHRAAVDAVRYRHLSLLKDHGGQLPEDVKGRQLQDTRALLSEVVQRGRTTVAELVAELDTSHRAGLAIARRAIEDVSAGCRSAPECELRDLISISKVLPQPAWNAPLPEYDPQPGEWMIYPDGCWIEARLVVEVNSTQWHKLGDGPEKTERRMAKYGELGWMVIPVSPHRIRTEPADVLRQLETVYLARTAK